MGNGNGILRERDRFLGGRERFVVDVTSAVSESKSVLRLETENRLWAEKSSIGGSTRRDVGDIWVYIIGFIGKKDALGGR